jgi:tripeptidyl-peptidase-1
VSFVPFVALFGSVVVDGSEETGGWSGSYGTSASSPVFAGVVAKLNDLRLRAGRPALGFLNPFLYANPASFNDVVWGEIKGAGFAGFSATSGWDAATGLGTPNFEALAAAAMTPERRRWRHKHVLTRPL